MGTAVVTSVRDTWPRARRLGLAVLLLLVLARSGVFVLWPSAHFDADQAVTGLMAKHLAEGRAFPVFAYAQQYLLAIEPWLAAPLFRWFGPTVPVLKTIPLLFNVATVALLFIALTGPDALRPAGASSPRYPSRCPAH